VNKCPECGIEYSYGRYICHSCNDSAIFSGVLLNESNTEYAWNCLSGMGSMTSHQEEKRVMPRDNIMPKNEKRVRRKWNLESKIHVQEHLLKSDLKLAFE
jgi:hypothetical protein